MSLGRRSVVLSRLYGGWRPTLALVLSLLVVGSLAVATPASADGGTSAVGSPVGLAVDGVGCLAPESARARGSAPVLAGVPQHGAGTAAVRVQVRTVPGDVEVRSWLSPVVSSGELLSWQVDAPLADGLYRWRMGAEDGQSQLIGAWSGWCGFAVDSALDDEPAPEQSLVECPIGPAGPWEAAGESAALLLAAACDEPVEVLSERDFNTRVMAQPDGVLLAEQFTVPQWAFDADGDWVPADPSFEVGAGGVIATAAAVSRVQVSSGGSGPFITATSPEGFSLSFIWPDPLPTPVVDGATVTYPEVFEHVDLRVNTWVDGFSYVLVVKSPAAIVSDVQVSINSLSLSVSQDPDGAVVATDGQGNVVFSAPAAYMWDSSDPEDGSEGLLVEEGSGDADDMAPGRFTQIPLDLDGDVLTVVPDQDLLTDPEAEFPIFIDPPFSGSRMHWATIHQQQSSRGWTDDTRWPREGGMRVGRLGQWPGFPCGDACGLWRSVIRFNTSSIRGKEILSAAVKATQTHTSGCGSYGLQLWRVNAFTSGTSWNGMSSKWIGQLQSKSLASSNRTGGCSGTSNTGVTYDNSNVRQAVQSAANAENLSISFGFRSSDESSINPYRRISVSSVKLEVVYNTPATAPTSLRTDGVACATSAPGPWLTTTRPTLSGIPRDGDGRVGAHLQIRRIGSTSTHYSWQSSRTLQHNVRASHRIPAGSALASGEYRWRMRSLDNHSQAGASDWNQWCYFRVDVTAPTTPTVELLGDPPGPGEQVTLRLRSSDAHSGLSRFTYGIDEEVPRHSVSSSGTSDIVVTAPTGGGRTWIYLWAHDNAGNSSQRVLFDFFTARLVEATPAAAWRLDGDGFDDSGQGHHLRFGAGTSWSSESGLGSAGSLDFDGTGCVSTEGPVVRTDAEYSVSAWVWLDSATGDYNFVTQAGDVNSGFNLKARDGQWRISIAQQDAPGTSFAAMNVPASVGQWTHLVVLVDPAGERIALYVDGQFADDRDIPWPTWHAAGPLHIGCAARIDGSIWDPHVGGIHHVGLWQGLLTPAQIQAAYAGYLPAGVTGDWRLRGGGLDGSPHARPVTVPVGGGFVDDQFGRRFSALHLGGSGVAESAGQVVRTDASFAVAGWARLADKSTTRVVVAQEATIWSGFYLRYHSGSDRWEFAMASQDSVLPSWHVAQSQAAPLVDQWYHLVGVFDATAGELRLYVDGVLQDTTGAPATPWHVDGKLLIGASGTTLGTRTDHMNGAISGVMTWRGAPTDDQITEAYGGNPAVRWLAQWRMDGNGADDIGAHGLTLVGTELIDYEWVDDRDCFPFSALGLLLSGQGHARTTDPVVVTDESFTVTAWVKLDSLGSSQTVVSQAGADTANLQLRVTADGRWQFVMAQQDTPSAGLAVAQTPAATAQTGVWTHLAGVFDLGRGELRLYVDGLLADVGTGVDSPWQATGPMYLGVAGTTGAGTSQQLQGAIDNVTAWSSTLDPDRILELAFWFGGVPCI